MATLKCFLVWNVEASCWQWWGFSVITQVEWQILFPAVFTRDSFVHDRKRKEWEHLAARFHNKTFLFFKWLITPSDLVNISDSLCSRDEAFAGLESLEWLKLEDNSLTRLGGEPVFPRGLKGVELHNNPFLCDCHLQDFTRWLQLTAVPRVSEPSCLRPPRLEVPALPAL